MVATEMNMKLGWDVAHTGISLKFWPDILQPSKNLEDTEVNINIKL
jgi:hypothetical protein